MCKILVIPSVHKSKSAEAYSLLKASRPFLTATDSDGFGYAAVANNQMFGENWLDPSDAFENKGTDVTEIMDKQLLQRYGSMVDKTLKLSRYRHYGTQTASLAVKEATAFLAHARYSTCAKNIQNTHPFYRGNTALIHNGVIENSYQLTNITSTCDSETILNEYIDSKVRQAPMRIQDVASRLEGWYAVAILTQTQGRWVVDIFKESQSSLICGFVKELDATVFCTTESILKGAVKAVKMTLSSVFKVKAGIMVRTDVESGKVTANIPFTPNQYNGRSVYQGWTEDHDMSNNDEFSDEVDKLINISLSGKTKA